MPPLRFLKGYVGTFPGDPMRLLFERDLTPHPQYAAFYKWMEHGLFESETLPLLTLSSPPNPNPNPDPHPHPNRDPDPHPATTTDAVVHFGMHGTVEWLPGSPLGSTGLSWSDVLLGDMPNLYVYAANNPSESIVAKRRGFGTIVSHNVPPYGRAGLYKTLAELRSLLQEHREGGPDGRNVLREPIATQLAVR